MKRLRLIALILQIAFYAIALIACGELYSMTFEHIKALDDIGDNSI